MEGVVNFFTLSSCFLPPNALWGKGFVEKGQMPLLFLWLKSMEMSLLLAAGSSSEASLSEQEAEGAWGPWSVWLMDGQLVTGTSYRFLHRSGMRYFFSLLFFFILFFFPLTFLFPFWSSKLKVSKKSLKT